jgi:hypothetical protein
MPQHPFFRPIQPAALLLALALPWAAAPAGAFEDAGFGDGTLVDDYGDYFYPQPDGSYLDTYGNPYDPAADAYATEAFSGDETGDPFDADADLLDLDPLPGFGLDGDPGDPPFADDDPYGDLPADDFDPDDLQSDRAPEGLDPNPDAQDGLARETDDQPETPPMYMDVGSGYLDIDPIDPLLGRDQTPAGTASTDDPGPSPDDFMDRGDPGFGAAPSLTQEDYRTLRFRERYFETDQDLVPTGSEDLGSAPLTYDEALEERVHGDLIDSDQDLERLDPFSR